MNLRLELLGPPVIQINEEAVNLPRRRSRALLYYLAAAGAPQSRDHLIALLWPNLDEPRARHAFRSTLYQLRRTGLPIEADRETVHFSAHAKVWVDVTVFRQGVARLCAPTDPMVTGPMALAQLTELAALYRGEFLEGFYLNSLNYEEWLYLEREHWRGAYLDVLECLIEAQIEAGHYLQALNTAQQALATDPLQERFHRAAMRLLAWLGQRTEALTQYERCVQILRDKLGTAPLDETEALHRAILEGKVVPPIGTPGAGGPAGERWPAPGCPSPFVGQRSGHWVLSEVLARAESDPTPVVMITGEPGVGKTRLVQEVLAASPVITIWGTAHPAPLPRPYAPLIGALRTDLSTHGIPDGLEPAMLDALAPLLPELGPGSGPTDPARLWEALALWPVARAKSGPVALVLDDIQWTDDDTWAALPTLLDRWSRAPIALIGIVHPTEIPFPATDLARYLARTGRMVVVPLAGLPPGDVAELLAWLTGEHSADVSRFADRLHAATGGNPLFLLETLRTLVEPKFCPQPADWRALCARHDVSFPTDLDQAVAQRLARWGPAAVRLAELLAVAVHPCSRTLLAQVGPFDPPALMTALSTLTAGGLVEERDGEYVFAHDALRSAVYRAISPDRRRALHRRVADALVEDPTAASGPLAVDLVGHYLEAGAHAQAQVWARRAADYASRVGAPAVAARAADIALNPQAEPPCV